jgi:hypothetical protein
MPNRNGDSRHYLPRTVLVFGSPEMRFSNFFSQYLLMLLASGMDSNSRFPYCGAGRCLRRIRSLTKAFRRSKSLDADRRIT